MKKINEQLDMFAGSEDVYKDAVENMKSVRKLAAERLKEREKAAKDLEKATATKKVRLQGTKEPKLPKNHYTERLDVVNRKELAKLVESAKKEGKKFKVSRSLKEGFRYTLMLEGKLEEARGKGKGQKLDKYFKLVNRLHKDKLTEEEVAEINKAIDEVKSFEPAGEWEEKDKKNLLDQLTMVLDVVDVPIKEEFERKNLINLPQSVQDALYDWAETGVDAHLLSKEGDNFIFDFETYNKFLEVCDSPESYWENWVDVDKYETFHPKDLLKTLVEHYGAKEEDIKGISDTEVMEAALFVDTEVIEEYRRKYATEDLEESKKLKEAASDENILDILGIEGENREKAKPLIAQYKKLEGKYPNASIWLRGEEGVYTKGKVVGKTKDLVAVNEAIKESAEIKLFSLDVYTQSDDTLFDDFEVKASSRKEAYELGWKEFAKREKSTVEKVKKEFRLLITEIHDIKEVEESKSLKEEIKINVEKMKDILNNQIDWTEVDEYGDVDFARDQLRSLHSNNVISDDEYNYININWDSLLESKSLKESNELQNSPYKELIGSYFNHTFDFDFLDVVAETLSRIDFDVAYNFEGEVESAVQDALIYTKSQWIVAKHYVSNPADLNWDDVISEFGDDIEELARKINKGDIKESLDDVKDPTHKLDEALKIITELSEFEPWSGAIDTWDKIINAGYEQELEDLLEEWYPEGITITELNDLLWHDGEDLLDHLGIEDTEELDLPADATTTVEELGYSKQEIEDDDSIVGDWLSDEYGFTHYGFNYYVNDDNEVIITDIEWDTSESYYKNSKRDKLFEDFVKNDILSSDDAEYIKDSTSWVTNPDRLVVELLDEMINAGASLNAVVPILKEHGLDTDRIIADGAREKADSIDIANAPVDYSLDDDIGVEPPVDFEATDNGDLEVDGEFEWVDDEYGWDFEENLVPVDEDANPLSHKNLSVLWDKYHDEDKVIGELEKLGLDIDRGDLQGVVEAFVLMLDEEPQDIPESKPLKEDLKRKPLKEQKGKYNIIASVSGLQESVIKKTDNLTEALNFVQAVEDKYLYALVVEGTTGRIITDFPEE